MQLSLTLNFLLAQRFWGVAKGRYINFLNNNNIISRLGFSGFQPHILYFWKKIFRHEENFTTG